MSSSLPGEDVAIAHGACGGARAVRSDLDLPVVQGRHDRGLAALLPAGDHLRFAAPVRRVERDGDVTRTAIEYGVERYRAVVEMDLPLAVPGPLSRGDLVG